jgi:SNF2 family DNA or RNA helicase
MIEYIPHTYQKKGYRHVMENSYAGLFLDMGLGKTIITLSALVDLLLIGEIKRILIIAPLRVANTVWKQEAHKWNHTSWLKISTVTGTQKQRINALQTDAQIYVINRENVKWLCEQYDYVLPFDTLVVDELSSFKSHDAQRFKALKRTRHCFKRIIGLTGTPMSNGYMDLWSQLYVLDGGKRLAPYITRYRNNYFYQERVGANEHAMKYILKEGADVVINDTISDICISMRSEDYLDLPPFIVRDEWVTLPEEVYKDYKTFEKDRIIELLQNQITANNKAGLSNKLLQYSNGACYYGDTRDYVIVHEQKMERLLALIEKADKQPVLVAYQYRHDLERIYIAVRKAFPELNVQMFNDDSLVDEWNNRKIDVLIAHPASAGHGLNLQSGGSIIIWYGLTWSLELYQQFNKRLHRQGISKPVICYRIMCEGTYDDIVRLTLDEKGNTQDIFMQYINNVMSS